LILKIAADFTKALRFDSTTARLYLEKMDAFPIGELYLNFCFSLRKMQGREKLSTEPFGMAF